MLSAASATALSLALLGMLGGASGLPADRPRQETRPTTQNTTAREAADLNLAPRARDEVWKQFLLQVLFVQDESIAPDSFDQNQATFLNVEKWARPSGWQGKPRPWSDDDWDVVGDVARASHFQDDFGYIKWTGWPSGDNPYVGRPPSLRTLKANFASGKLVLGDRNGGEGIKYEDTFWSFGGDAKLGLRDGRDARLKICRSGSGTRTGDPAADRLSVVVGGKAPENDTPITELDKWGLVLASNPPS
ncbi:MAG: hypothetical protein M1832_003430 [Thelocarpon impressellum]|nr:MAG: hypothetical protein M1832_003430 [Thelocarpon impressellum]